MLADESPIDCRVEEGVAEITLNRPDAGNTLDVATVRGLLEIVARCETDPKVRAVLIRGSGHSFCAGGDVKEFVHELESGRGDVYPRSVAADLHQAVSRLCRLDAPVVVAVRGVAAGAGLSLVCAADIAVATSDARFCVGYSGIGLTMDGGLSYFLPRAVGRRRALDFALTNRVVDAEEAPACGLVTQVVRPTELDAHVRALLRALASGPTKAFGDIKRLLDGGWRESLETQLELEARSISSAFAARDGAEGIAAFSAKRRAVFSGD
jgi:2-(1,2-epoxy-1,2-dihydrophenyl)acetyl-CoA isomerase